jgi:hypothetical protein
MADRNFAPRFASSWQQRWSGSKGPLHCLEKQRQGHCGYQTGLETGILVRTDSTLISLLEANP